MLPQYPSFSQANLGSLEVAQKRLLKRIIDNGFKLKTNFLINQKRYALITGIQNEEPKKILLVYKRDLFHNFGLELRHLGATGMGETLNCDDLKLALQIGVTDVYFTYPNGSCYTMPLMEFLEKSFKWTNKEGKRVRSISIHKLKRLYDLK